MKQDPNQALRAAVERVIDPLLERPLGELGAVQQASREGDQGRVSVVRTSASAGYLESLRARVEEAVRAEGVSSVQFETELRVPTRSLGGDDPVPNVRNVVLVMSGKGGVGKSTVAVNIAAALQAQGARVGLLDADIYGPSIPTMLGVTEHPKSTDGRRMDPIKRHGLLLMSIGFMLEDPKAAVIWRGPMLHGALRQFLTDVDWGELDYLVMDLPPGTGDVALTLAQNLSLTGALLVTTPQEVALQDVYKGVSMCKKLNIPVLGVVENMSHFVDSAGVRHELFGAGGGQAIAEFAEAPLVAQIPMEPAVRQGGDEGQPIVVAQPETEAAKALQLAADRLADEIALAHFKRAGAEALPPHEAPKRLKVVR